MPIEMNTPTAAAPADRLSLTTESARGEQAGGASACCACYPCCYCLADEA